MLSRFVILSEAKNLTSCKARSFAALRMTRSEFRIHLFAFEELWHEIES